MTTNTHYVSETNPTHVTHAEWYRISLTRVLTPQHENFDGMQSIFPPEYRRPEGYGLAFLESEEHSRLYVGSIQQITEYQNDLTMPLDVSQGQTYDKWPHTEGWDTFIPDNTWNPDGRGIITAFEHPEGGDVIVYEFHGSWLKDKPKRPLVTFHCTHCHQDTFHDSGKIHENHGPHDRRWAARQARQHIHSAQRHGVGGENSQCQKADPNMMRIVTEVTNDIYGTNNPVTPYESMCATTGPCATIRELKALQAART
ncbi:hypothetical protein [Streptomyces javensis]|uniref:Uncharacterized protein n=1 Tax=Streptomyces javensis TaxID=114698 RepID=A0ABS0R5Y2_9ACTN|nr:hypothetical protein [Streptomyces javensis]MBI0312718.1 hypothetical protein [Streptomyces javensis]